MGALRADALVQLGGADTYDKTTGTLALSPLQSGGVGFSGTAMLTAPTAPAYGSDQIYRCVTLTGGGVQAHSGFKPSTWSNGGTPLRVSYALAPGFTISPGAAPDMYSFSWTVTMPTL